VLIRASSCSPETLVRLQRIFDAVWRDVDQQKGKRTFPWISKQPGSLLRASYWSMGAMSGILRR